MESKMERLQEVFCDVFGDTTIEISEDTIIKDIEGWDSLVHISLMAAVQDEFGVVYSIEDITKINSVKDILETLAGIDNL